MSRYQSDGTPSVRTCRKHRRRYLIDEGCDYCRAEGDANSQENLEETDFEAREAQAAYDDYWGSPIEWPDP